MDIQQVGSTMVQSRKQAEQLSSKNIAFQGKQQASMPADQIQIRFGNDNPDSSLKTDMAAVSEAFGKIAQGGGGALSAWLKQGQTIDGQKAKTVGIENVLYGGILLSLQQDALVAKFNEATANVKKLETALGQTQDPAQQEKIKKSIEQYQQAANKAKGAAVAGKQSIDAIFPDHYRNNLNGQTQERLLKKTFAAVQNRVESQTSAETAMRDLRILAEGFVSKQNQTAQETGAAADFRPEAFTKYLKEEGLSNTDLSLETKQTILVLGGLTEEAKELQSTSARKRLPANPDYGKRYKEIVQSGNATDAQLQALEDLLRNAPQSGPFGGGGGAGQDTVKKRMRLAFFDLPWEKSPERNINIDTLKEILDEDHFGMENVKKEIVDYFITAKHLKANGRSANGKILLLVGPPGTGKTSIAKSIARGLGRNFTKMSVAGVRDEAKIRGFESTYVNSKHGGIVQGMVEAGSLDPVFVIDEVDKMSGGGPQGDPEQALHEVLDPEQNYDFRDHFISEVPVDLSNNFWILTANRKEDIPDSILSRCKVVDLNKYSIDEKKEIAKRHMIPGVLRKNMIPPDMLNITDAGLEEILQKHAVEPGVRELERTLTELATKNIGLMGDKGAGGIIKEFTPEVINDVLPPFQLDRPAESQEDFYKLLSRLDADKLITQQQYNQIDREINKVARSGSNRMSQDDEGVKKRLQVALQELPWRPNQNTVSVEDARKALNEDHTGLDNVKEALLDYVAVLQRQKRMGIKGKGKIICLSGPPGTGKTSIVKSVAKALGRDFAKIDFSNANSLSFVAGDSPAIRDGKPGAFVKALSEAGSTNAVLLLDEIEKAHDDRIANSLMVALDPNYNDSFHDNNLKLDVDLSDTIMISTTNDLSKLHPALRNRMEIIDVNAYVPSEKMQIAKNHLVGEALRENGLEEAELPLTDEGLETIRGRYTREGGVRELQRSINRIAEYIAARKEQGLPVPKTIDPEAVQEILGQPKVFNLGEPTNPEVGVVNGLAVSGDGSTGSLLNFISTVHAQKIGGELPGKIVLQNLGNHEDLITKSVKVAFRWIQENARRYDVKVPEGYNLEVAVSDDMLSIPKDGDSAGAAFVNSVMSALTNRPLRHDVAMTGTITLNNKVKAIGGVPQKLFGAYEKGMNVVFVPMQNFEHDVPYLPESQAKLMEPMTITEFKTKYANELATGQQIKGDKMIVVGVEDVNDILNYTLLPAVKDDQYYWANVVEADKKAEANASTNPVQFSGNQKQATRLNLVS